MHYRTTTQFPGLRGRGLSCARGRRSDLSEGQCAEHQTHAVTVKTNMAMAGQRLLCKYVAPTPYNEHHNHPCNHLLDNA